jgi:hypothetical protein
MVLAIYVFDFGEKTVLARYFLWNGGFIFQCAWWEDNLSQACSALFKKKDKRMWASNHRSGQCRYT